MLLPLRSLMQGLVVSGLYAGSCLAQREPPNMDRRDGPAALFYEISFEKDPGLVREWAQITGTTARRTIATPRATEPGKRRLDLARQVATYVEYLAYTEILATTARPRKLELMEEFLKASPNSSYAPAVQRLWFATLRESDPPKALAIAEQMILADQANEDVLMMVAEN